MTIAILMILIIAMMIRTVAQKICSYSAFIASPTCSTDFLLLLVLIYPTLLFKLVIFPKISVAMNSDLVKKLLPKLSLSLSLLSLVLILTLLILLLLDMYLSFPCLWLLYRYPFTSIMHNSRNSNKNIFIITILLYHNKYLS